MEQTLAIWLLVGLALICANLPFLTERVFAIVPWRQAGTIVAKPVWVRLAELLVFYLLIGALAFAVEAQLGNRFRQGWEFYAITLSLFVVLGYPGFVLRYLVRRRRAT